MHGPSGFSKNLLTCSAASSCSTAFIRAFYLRGCESLPLGTKGQTSILQKWQTYVLHETLENIKNLVSFSFLYISEEMCKVLGIIFLQTEWNGPIVRFLSNSYCVIVFPAWHESKKNEHSPRFEVCLASKSRIPELETQPEIWGNMYLLHYKSVKAVQVNIEYTIRSIVCACHPAILYFKTDPNPNWPQTSLT